MNKTVTKTVEIELNASDVGVWLANAGSDEQAEVLNIVAREFAGWWGGHSDYQLLSIARLLTPFAKMWVRDLHESVEFVNGGDAIAGAIPDGITPGGAQVIS